MSFAGQNMRYLRKLSGWTQEELATKLSLKRSLIGAYEEGRAEPKLEALEQMSLMFKFSLDDLFLKDLSLSNSKSFMEIRRDLKLGAQVAVISFVPYKASAGYMNGYADPDFLDELNTFTLPMVAPGDYRAFEIIGDSMLPTPSGSVVVGEKVERLDDVKTSNTYILVSKSEGIVYKRIVKHALAKNKIILESDNPNYEPYIIGMDDVLEVWRAVYILQKANASPKWDFGSLAGMVNNLQEQVITLQKKVN